MLFKRSCMALCGMMCLAASSAMFAGIEDLDGEEDIDRYEKAPDSEWKEDALVIPPYPLAGDLIEVDLSLPVGTARSNAMPMAVRDSFVRFETGTGALSARMVRIVSVPSWWITIFVRCRSVIAKARFCKN